MDIKGKTALVLGANRGIGRGIADALAQKGARLIVTHFDWPDDTQTMLDTYRAKGIDHLPLQIDLRSPDQIKELFSKIYQKYNGLDILINNIERGGMPVVHGAYTPGQWDLEIETTLKAKWWVFDSALPLLRKSSEGAVVVLSSIASIVGRSGPAGLIFNDGYAAANRAVSSFTETWARQGAPTIRVNELMLGFIANRHAENTRGWGLLTEKQQNNIISHCLLKRTGQIEEVVRTVLFLIEEATYMTGATIRLDGGYPLGAEVVPDMPDGVV